jgi:hypothetical protein
MRKDPREIEALRNAVHGVDRVMERIPKEVGFGGRTERQVSRLLSEMVPIVAAADGVVGWMHDEQGGLCCAMELVHDDGYRSWYIHMNNDTPGTDDGQGFGFVPGIEQGVHMQAGQQIGWVGDSATLRTPGRIFTFRSMTRTMCRSIRIRVCWSLGNPTPASSPGMPPQWSMNH